MLKEDDLIDCVLSSLQAYIRHIASLDELLDIISEEQINREDISRIHVPFCWSWIQAPFSQYEVLIVCAVVGVV